MDKLIVFRPTGEVRRAEPEEYVLMGQHVIWRRTGTLSEFPILTRHEIDATPEILKVMEGN
jgi:hypothetical protein